MPDASNPTGEALVFRRDADKLYLTNAAWPLVALRIAEAQVVAADAVELLRDESTNSELVNIVVANGFALYAVQADGSAKYVEGELSAAPPAPEAPPAPALVPVDAPAPAPAPEAAPVPAIEPSPVPEVVADAPPVAPGADSAPPPAPEVAAAPAVAPEAALPDMAKPADPMPPPVEDPAHAALRAALQAPNYPVGTEIKYDASPIAGLGLFQCGVDGFGRVWKVDQENDKLILAGSLQT